MATTGYLTLLERRTPGTYSNIYGTFQDMKELGTNPCACLVILNEQDTWPLMAPHGGALVFWGRRDLSRVGHRIRVTQGTSIRDVVNVVGMERVDARCLPYRIDHVSGVVEGIMQHVHGPRAALWEHD